MSERRLEVKVGILITVCVALLVVFIVLLGNISMADRSPLYLDVETSGAVKKGAPVKIAGVRAGEIAEIQYHGGKVDPRVDRPVMVRIVLDIDTDKLATIHEDAKFFITTQGVLGEKYVEIEPGRFDTPVVEPGAIKTGEPPLDIGRMAANANRVLTTVDRLLRDNEEGIAGIIDNAASTMKTVRSAAERIDAILIKADTLVDAAAPKVEKAIDELLLIEAEAKDLAVAANVAIGDGSQLRGIISKASGLVSDLRGATPRVVRKVEGTLGKYGDLADVGSGTLTDTKARLFASLDRVDDVLDDVKFLTGQMRDGKGTIGALLSDQEMYDDIREMMRDLKRHPWKFIWKE